MQSEPPDLPRAREPEIEFLGRLARRVLTMLRLALFVAGLVAIAVACYITASPPEPAPNEVIAPLQQRIASNFVWVCAGTPLLLPSRWMFRAGWWKALALGLALWLGPMLLDGDHPYGFVIRMFASFVTCVTLLVLRVLRTLGAEPVAPA
jgi:hypothetical protein